MAGRIVMCCLLSLSSKMRIKKVGIWKAGDYTYRL
jgi:hypothetical protein